MKTSALILLICMPIVAACNSNDVDSTNTNSDNVAQGDQQKDKRLDRINLPSGFEIDIFGEVQDARSLAISPSGVVYVGNMGGDVVTALRDSDGDGRAEEKFEIASGLKLANGVAFRDGDLYVAGISKIVKFPNIEADLKNPADHEVITEAYPTKSHHGWKYIAFGPDGKLYVPVGAPCNTCENEEQIFASITRINPDGSGLEIIAEGVRNTVGFDWHPDTKELWFTDNGRDMLGDNVPPCELNRLSEEGLHFGYPYCHGDAISDPEFGDKRECSEFVKPAWNFEAHTAPLGMKFYTGGMFPEAYRGDAIVAQHGSWNRSQKIGYRLMRVSIEGNRATGAEVFADGWLNDDTQEAWGRPVDVLQMPDGALLVSDDEAGLVYRITYQK